MGPGLCRRIHSSIKIICYKEEIPVDCKMGTICPKYKKGDGNKCDNYKGITLLSCIYKVLSSIINNRLKEYTEKIISDYQNGFRSNRGAMDDIHILRRITEKAYEYNI